MPSIFSRQRTSSSPNPNNISLTESSAFDEFGRVRSRGGDLPPPPTPRKDNKHAILRSPVSSKKKGADSLPPDQDSYESSLRLDEAGFYPFTSLPPVLNSSDSGPAVEDVPYGHLAHKREVVLSLFQITLLIDDISSELSERGLQVPFLFSTLAIDLNPGAVRRLVDSFLTTCMTGGSRERWLEDKKFAGVHELGMVLRWGLARVMRRGERRGLLEFEHYLAWREDEEAQDYPATHISQFFASLHPSLIQPVSTIFNLLSLLISHAHTSGLTPSTLASLFGPLLFGLALSPPFADPSNPTSPAAVHIPVTAPEPSSGASFHQVHETYLGNTNAFEHLLLSYIRLRAATTPGGIPPRLANWIKGYPRSILPSSTADLFKPRPGAKMLRVLAVRRNVRIYSSDLVRSCASWAHKTGGVNSLTQTREWYRIAPSSLPVSGPAASPTLGNGSSSSKLDPRYSDGYRKRMNLPTSFYPIATPFVTSTTNPYALKSPHNHLSPKKPSSSPSPSGSSTLSPGRASLGLSRSTTSLSSTHIDENEEVRFTSLVDLRWAAFENGGFNGDDAFSDKLKLDLNERARKPPPPQRETLTWADFSESGFLREPGGSTSRPGSAKGPSSTKSGDWSLDGALQFDNILVEGVKENERVVEDMGKKLKKSSKNLPPFGWDTSPVTSEELIEEGFLACFCDIIYSGGVGWMDRGQRWLRTASWGLIEFKSIPPTPTSPPRSRATTTTSPSTSTPGQDPRTSSTLLLFEEFVPAEYRAQLLNPKQKSRFPLPLAQSLNLPGPLGTLSGKSAKKWKQAATLNGVPYVPGQVPTTFMSTLIGRTGRKEREREFEGLLEQAGNEGTTLRIAVDGTRTHVTRERESKDVDKELLAVSGSREVGGGIGRSHHGVSSPLYVEAGNGNGGDDGIYPRQMDRAPTFPLSVMSSPQGGDASPDITPTPRKSRFRLGVGINRKKGSGTAARNNGHGLTMDDLDHLDFETRTTGSFTSGSGGSTPPAGATTTMGDEKKSSAGGSKGEDGKHSRQKSKDDTWVDILVASNSRRMTGQDATIPGSSRADRRKTADPEMTRREVEKIIREAGTPPPDLDDDDLRGVGRSHRDPKRGAGVFEYDHRHDPVPSEYGDEDGLEGDDDDDIQEVDYAPPKQQLYSHRNQPQGGSHAGYRSQDQEDMGSISSEDEDERTVENFPPVPSHKQGSGSQGVNTSRPLPSTPSPARSGTGGGSGGVSALIEKYASLSSSSSPAPSPQGASNVLTPSRLPVRSSSLNKDLPSPVPGPGKDAQAHLDPSSVPTDFPRPISPNAQAQAQSGAAEPSSPEQPRAISPNNASTLTPSRYVHGAPLHNLPEDPEEEE